MRSLTMPSLQAFCLEKSSLDSKVLESSSLWFALSLKNCRDSVHTAHEKDSSQFQNEIEHFPLPSLVEPHDHDDLEEAATVGFASTVDIAANMKERLATLGKRKANQTLDTEPSNASGQIAPKKKTATTARNFFSSRNSGTNGTASVTNKKSKRSVSTLSSSQKSSAKTETARTKPPSKMFFKSKEGTHISKQAKQIANEEKENVQNKSPTVGNADDLVFDEESSDEEVEEETVPKASQSRQTFTSTKEDIKEEEKYQEAPLKTEEPQPKNSSRTGAKRRRKRMVEKTYTDENGYLFTETKAVWEDVSSSDDEKESSTANKTVAPAANKSKKSGARPKSMKQASLMGFFGKKK